ncbi:MAG TPA: OmpA family protein [Steroidobacteraceae bacterium]|nr:OmpA family protein [Steroidobacteraceae bacterium]
MTAAGTVIRNSARVEYLDTNANPASVQSNDVALNVAPPPSLSTINLLRASAATGEAMNAGPTQCRGNNGTVTLPAPTMSGGASIDISQPVALLETTSLHGGEPVFVRLADADRNRDATIIDSIEVQLATEANDRETLRLSETGTNTGVFIGYVQTRANNANVGNCVLEVERNAEITTTYVDPEDAADTSRANVLVDPYGLIFDSSTGAPVNGARVRLVNAATGANAVVVGDDGVSTYPAEMVTGTNVTDAGGTVYSLPPGVFRFPLVAPGSYRIEVVPPAGHAFPSSLEVQKLGQLSGAPFRLSAASFGTSFAIDAPPAVAIDVPIDPAATQLFMQKTTPTSVAAIGDFVQYTLIVQNTSTNAAVSSMTTIDRMPAGMRYRAGSTRIDGERAADPTISADGQTLTSVTSALAPNRRREIRYVAEITAGAHGKRLVNSAQTQGPDGVASNAAQASIELREELFRDRAFIMGRVVEGACNVAAQQQVGVPGVRVYLEDGRYAMTDEEGKYHFDDVMPGSHVVQIDALTIPDTHRALECADRVRHAGRAYSQFADVRGGALWRSDFVLERKPLPRGSVALALQTATVAPARLNHTATLDVQQLGITNARVLVMLPDGLKYVPGSSRVEPIVQDTMLSFGLGDVPQLSTLTFSTEASAGSSGALTIKALATFESASKVAQRTEAIENTVLRGEMLYESATYRFAPRFDVLDTRIQASDRVQLERIVDEWRGVTNLRLSAIGHTDATLIAARSRQTFTDNRVLSRARAEAVANYLSERLGVDPARVVIEGRGSEEPIAVGHDAKSLALNRRVDIAIEGLRVIAAGALTLKKPNAISPQVDTVGVLDARPLVKSTAPAIASSASTTTPSIDLEQLQPELSWLLPIADDMPSIPSIKVAIQHLPAQQLELRVNGAVVSPLNFDGVAANTAGTAALSRWRGVALENGDNELLAVVRDEHGTELSRLTRKVHYAGGAVRAELVRDASTLLADGRAHPVIALRMVDAYGKPARPGTLGAYRVEAPYRSWWEVQTLDDNKLVATGTREPTFSVDQDGLARLTLEPTTQAGTAVIRLRFNERQQQEIRVWLEPQARDWILVGIAEGTAAHKTISDNMQAAADAGLDEGYADQGRVAFFAKGAVKGEFLLTAAYDSAREHGEAKERLLGVIEPDRFYTLYGDATEQRFEAATARKLFLKLERRQFAAMFGDFETGLTVTELSRYSRTLTGVKSDYAGEHFGYSAFAAQSDQGFVKDEIPGDGTSGLYRLSRRPLIINSDKLRLEIRDRLRSEVVVESRPLTRFLDYSIDYLNGTVFFKQPVPSRDQNFNPVLIVAEYEVISGGKEQTTAGGRAAVKFADDVVEVGASFLQEGAAVGDTRVAGTDVRWRIGAATELKAELARTESADPSVPADALGYLTELTHVTETLDARAYVREQETGFGVGQQLSSEGGTRKAGVDARYHVTEHTVLEGEAYRQNVLTSGAQRDLVSTEVRREMDDYTVGVGVRHVEDQGATVANGNASAYAGGESQQAFVNGSVDLFDDLITLHASQDVALGGKNASVDFPNRSLVGLDYHWRADTTLFAEYEHADGAQFDADMTRVGVRAVPWQRAQLQSSMTQQASEFGPRVFANVGLTQGWQVTERWALDFGVDQSKTVSGSPIAPFNPNVALASGTLGNDFVATFIGALYRSELWTVTSRIENRTSDDEDRLVFSGGFYREPVAGHAFSLATQYFDSRFAVGTDASVGEVQLGWVYRPVVSSWIVLDRLDLKNEKTSDVSGTFESARAINNLNANWQLDMRTQLGIQFGARYVRSTFDEDRYTGTSTLIGLDVRRDLTSTFDVGVHGSMLSSLDANVSDQSIGIDVGMTLVKNVWISVGYNVAGFHDDDFEASRYLAQGPYIKFRMKADQDTFKDLISGARPR